MKGRGREEKKEGLWHSSAGRDVILVKNMTAYDKCKDVRMRTCDCSFDMSVACTWHHCTHPFFLVLSLPFFATLCDAH